MEPVRFALPAWWPRIIWNVWPGDVFGRDPIKSNIGLSFGTTAFFGWVRTAPTNTGEREDGL